METRVSLASKFPPGGHPRALWPGKGGLAVPDPHLLMRSTALRDCCSIEAFRGT
jgi:hypothetical protein